jgi:hypothetical protein
MWVVGKPDEWLRMLKLCPHHQPHEIDALDLASVICAQSTMRRIGATSSSVTGSIGC